MTTEKHSYTDDRTDKPYPHHDPKREYDFVEVNEDGEEDKDLDGDEDEIEVDEDEEEMPERMKNW